MTENVIPFDAVREGCSDVTPKPQNPKFPLIPAVAFLNQPNPGWYIQGIVPAGELMVIYGHPGSGKSFGALAMAIALARGIPWLGNRIKQARRVVYICAESSSGFSKRLKAYSQHHNYDFSNLPNLEIIAESPNFLPQGFPDAEIIAANIEKCDVIFVDTLACVMAGGDENKGQDMGQAIGACKLLHKKTGAMVVLVHHAGKQESSGARGWSGLKAAVDAELYVEKLENKIHKITVTKQKDGEGGISFGFELKQHTIARDEDDEAITSCVFLPCDLPAEEIEGKEYGPIQALLLAAYAEYLIFPVSYGDLANKVVNRMPRLGAGRDTRAQRVRQSFESLQRDKVFDVIDNLVYKI